MFQHGLVIGKFYPPHVGHQLLIDTAAEQCLNVTVVVLAAHAESIPLADRVAWLREIHAATPHVEVVGVRDDTPVDYGNAAIWDAHEAIMRAGIARAAWCGVDLPVDAVFSSEAYGPELARRFAATHVAVDPARAIRPVSGTLCRSDLAASWDLLHPVVRAGLATRIVVVGAESTGTTTVSRALAEHYRARGGIWARTGWVPEHGRDYTYEKHALAAKEALEVGRTAPAVEDLVWRTADFAEIARRQTDLENEAAAAGSPILICDTDAFATSVWEYRYVGAYSHGADEWAGPLLPRRDVYLLTDHRGVPFEDDGWRDGEHLRADMTDWFIDRLTAAGHSWVLLTGSREQRMRTALAVCEEALGRRSAFGSPPWAVTTVL